jgi:hypothetical protein
LHGGKDEREADSPAYFNIKEAEAIGTYTGALSSISLTSPSIEHLVADLLRHGRDVKPDDVAVICPSPKQVDKLRKLFRARQLGGVKVASTEEFHGSEYK